MAILKIYTFPEPILRQKAKLVTKFDKELEKLATDMLETMYDAPGVGLAANQVGVALRLLVLDVSYSIEGGDDEAEDGPRHYVNQNPVIVINPELVGGKGEILFKEGCLSVPGFTEEVKRKEEIRLQYQDLAGQTHEIDANGLLAVAIQHEMDHLDGKLFIDRLSIAKRNLIKGKIKKDRNSKFERSRFHVEL